ncbi:MULTISPECIES: PfkB family carbohydrate kinase [Brevibacillus]|uniref:PfkB family carbohydrate kinase n=1 Tax=Brevibacillus TaxID=55080 RepID=UPI00156ADB2B|nr:MULTISPECIES: PfkB family carbohydrate kinase [Brevibacillus]MBU8711030.1 fructoselysine 6-kinase [Brevibacillus parabrevis]UED66689.1 PfkB family carbohydrate kinase [Brevibacillus sp. HD3.3A]
MKLIAIGDNVVDYYKDRGEIFPGGNALNVAVLGKRYQADVSSYIGIIGNDQAADHVRQTLLLEKIDISRLRQAIGPNGEAIVSLNADGDRVFVGSNKGGVQAYMGLRLTDDDKAYIARHELLHTSIYSNLEHELPELHKAIRISFDFSTRWTSAYLERVCPYVDYGFFSGSDLTEDECHQLIQQVHRLGTKVVGVTRGAQGAIFSEAGKLYRQEIVPTEVVDTLGAGDSFIAMFLMKYHPDGDMQAALRQASVAAAQTCGHYGAFGYGVPKVG